MSEQQSAPARPLYDLIERIRIREGWTKVQVARHLGMNRGTIENWKTQPRSPQATTVKDVANRLGIDYDEALALAGITGGVTVNTADATRDLELIEELEGKTTDEIIDAAEAIAATTEATLKRLGRDLDSRQRRVLSRHAMRLLEDLEDIRELRKTDT